MCRVTQLTCKHANYKEKCRIWNRSIIALDRAVVGHVDDFKKVVNQSTVRFYNSIDHCPQIAHCCAWYRMFLLWFKALFFCFRVVFIKILAWIDKILEISITLQEVTHFSYDTLVICCCQRRNLNEVKHSGKATVQSKIPKAKQGVHLLRRMDLQKVIEYATSRLELFLLIPQFILYSFVKFHFLKIV